MFERKEGRERHHLPGRGIAVAAAVLAMTVLAANATLAAPEHSLAGIKLFSNASVLLKKFGTPDIIKVGGQAAGGGGGAAAGGPPAGFGGPPPGFGGGPPPGFGGGPPAGFGGGGGGAAGGGTSPAGATVTWIYDRLDGSTLEFLLSSDGRVIQIHATGLRGSVRTVKGIVLGSGLIDVYTKYGYPETTTLSGNILTLTYTNRDHCAFQLLDRKVVGVTVAVVE
jgi:hypothetical protein